MPWRRSRASSAETAKAPEHGGGHLGRRRAAGWCRDRRWMPRRRHRTDRCACGEARSGARRRRAPHRDRARARGCRCRWSSPRPRRGRRSRSVRRRSTTSNRETVTLRAASSTSSPARARSYARRPPTLIAETRLGTCEISPVRSAIAAVISARVDGRGIRHGLDLAVGVVRVGGRTEADRRLVGLVEPDDEGQQARRGLDAEDQQARRHRIQRAGVPDLARAERFAGARDHVVARHAARLVDEQHPGSHHQQ